MLSLVSNNSLRTEIVAAADDTYSQIAFFLLQGLEGFGFSMLMDIYTLMLPAQDRKKGLCTVNNNNKEDFYSAHLPH